VTGISDGQVRRAFTGMPIAHSQRLVAPLDEVRPFVGYLVPLNLEAIIGTGSS